MKFASRLVALLLMTLALMPVFAAAPVIDHLLYFNGVVYKESGTQFFAWTGTAWGAAQADPRTPSSNFGIKTVGNKFTDLSGNILQLQGENVLSLEICYAPNMWDAFNGTTVAQWTSIKNAWQMNIIRVGTNAGAYLQNLKSAKGVGYQTILATAINNITAAGMYAIVDLHWDAPNSYSGQGCPAGVGDGQPGYVSQDNAIPYWTAIGNAFKANPAVLFELFNEPVGQGGGSPLPYLLNGSGNTLITFYDQPTGNGGMNSTAKTYKAAGHQQLVAAIRATGATNVILWSTDSWDSDLSKSLSYKPTDTLSPAQLAATVHYHGTTADYTNVLNAGVPVIETEYYNELPGGANYTFAQNNKVGYVMCCAHNYSGNPNFVTAGASENILANPPWSFNSASVAWPLH